MDVPILYPCTRAQQSFWLIDRMFPGSPILNLLQQVKIAGPINVPTLQKSLQTVVDRHDALRASFLEENGVLVQRIVARVPVDCSFTCLSGVSSDEKLIQLETLRRAMGLAPFDLETGPLFRFHLIQLDHDEYLLLTAFHHLVFDGTSRPVFFDELVAAYSGESLAPLPMQYGEYAVWQQQMLETGSWIQHEVYWKKALAGEFSVLELPTDHLRPKAKSGSAAVCTHTLPNELKASLKSLGKKHHSSLFKVLLAGFKVLLHRLTGANDLVVRTTLTGRARQEVTRGIGLFVNSAALRTQINGDSSFVDVLSQVQNSLDEAVLREAYPFEEVIRIVNRRVEESRAPLTDIDFTKIPPAVQRRIGALVFSDERVFLDAERLDLSVFSQETMEEIRLTIVYSTELFEAATIERMLGHFRNLLEGIVADPEQRISALPLLAEAEKHQLLVEWNDTKRDYPSDKCIHQLFEEQVDKTPDAIALVFAEQQLTYRELNNRANQLAHYLQKRGVGPEVLVPICVERSIEMMVGLLGLLKAGGAYIPLDPSYPQERLATTLEDVPSTVLLTQARLKHLLPDDVGEMICLDTDWGSISREHEENPQRQATLEDLAYVIFTSGSTGKPKGVMITHRGLTNYLNYCTTTYPVHEGRGSLVHSTIAFDATITGLYAPLLVGRAVYLLPQCDDLEGLARTLLQVGEFSLVKITPAHLTLLSQQIPAEKARSLTRAFVIGGENLTSDQIAFWQRHAPETRLYNEYGPTETVVGCIVYEARKWRGQGSVPIGRAIPNTTAYVLDRYGQPVPGGVTGELYLGGAGVARGYLNNTESTATKFIADRFSPNAGSRLYRTGDLVRRLRDGNYEFIGRIDDQVKIRGFRIELAEVEAALAQHNDIRESVVLVRGEGAIHKQLVAYLVATSHLTPPIAELRQFLKAKLPDYMVPAAFLFLDSLPLTVNGKVDRKALMALEGLQAQLENRYVAPRNQVEEKLAAIWSQELRVKRIGIHDSFFDLGGHSLLAVSLVAKMEKQLGNRVPLALLFKSPTIAQIASELYFNTHELSSPLIAVQPRGSKPPFFCAHGTDSYLQLARYLGPDQPFYGLAQHLEGRKVQHTRVEDIAAHYINEVRSVQPAGPYYIGGHSFGGLIAFEMAQQLQRQDQEIGLLVMLDTRPPIIYHRSDTNGTSQESTAQHDPQSLSLRSFKRKVYLLREALTKTLPKETKTIVCEVYQSLGKPLPPELQAFYVDEVVYGRIYPEAYRCYRPQYYYGPAVYFESEETSERVAGWKPLMKNGVKVHRMSGDHLNMLAEPNVRRLAETLKECLSKAQAGVNSTKRSQTRPSPHYSWFLEIG